MTGPHDYQVYNPAPSRGAGGRHTGKRGWVRAVVVAAVLLLAAGLFWGWLSHPPTDPRPGHTDTTTAPHPGRGAHR